MLDFDRAIATRHARDRHVLERWKWQLQFAEGLKRFQGDQGRAWEPLIARATATMEQAIAAAGDLTAALAAAEGMLAPLGAEAKSHTIHCVGHGHIDMNWQWPWQETVATCNDTFLTMLKLMELFPTFTYSQSQASVYHLAKRYHPELWARIKARIAEGRWEVTASHWVEGDKNIGGGEALCRHLLYTRRFMREELGLTPEDVTIDWSPDTFGHAHTLPGIDTRGGVKHYYMMRSGGIDRPSMFWWQGVEGSRVLVYRDPKGYGSFPSAGQFRDLLNHREASGGRDNLLVYGVGDHGGGPTRRALRMISDMDSWPIFPRWQFSTTKRFFGELEKCGDRLPVWDRELNFEYTGCYTSLSSIKRNNRIAETVMAEADTIAAIGRHLLGRPVPADHLRESWQDTLFNHFHDILPGSGVRATREYNGGQTQRIQAQAGAIKIDTLRAIAAAIDTSFVGSPAAAAELAENEASNLGGGPGWLVDGVSRAGHVHGHPGAFLVVNPNPWERREVVTHVIWEGDEPWDGKGRERIWVVRDVAGNVHPTQVLRRANWAHQFSEVAFPADVGPLAWNTLAVHEGTTPAPTNPARAIRVLTGGQNHPPVVPRTDVPYVLDNEHLRIVFDRKTSGIVSMVDKATGTEFADPQRPCALLEYQVERPYGMSSWIINDPMRTVCPLEVEAFDLQHEGPWIASFQAKYRLNDSRLTVTYTLKAGSRRLEIGIGARWVERGGGDLGTPRLNMRFPLALTQPELRCETPYGSERRETSGREVPALRWADLSGGLGSGAKGGVALLNDGKHGHSADGDVLRVTLIRSSSDPDPLPEIGDHAINLALVPHAGAVPASELDRLGIAFNQPLAVIGTDPHAGRLPAVLAEGARCAAGNAILAQIKPGDIDPDTMVLRVQEADGVAGPVRIHLSTAMFGSVTSAVETDVLERPLVRNGATVESDGCTVQVPAFGLATVLLRLKR